MPVMNGLEATATLRIDHGFTKPIIAVTANAQEHQQQECIQAGMNFVHTKPIHINKLIRQIKTAIASGPWSAAPEDAGALSSREDKNHPQKLSSNSRQNSQNFEKSHSGEGMSFSSATLMLGTTKAERNQSASALGGSGRFGSKRKAAEENHSKSKGAEKSKYSSQTPVYTKGRRLGKPRVHRQGSDRLNVPHGRRGRTNNDLKSSVSQHILPSPDSGGQKGSVESASPATTKRSLMSSFGRRSSGTRNNTPRSSQTLVESISSSILSIASSSPVASPKNSRPASTSPASSSTSPKTPSTLRKIFSFSALSSDVDRSAPPP